ncbi:cell wall binding repeat 2 family protein, partial [Clostridioides difficile CD160]
MKIPKKIAAMLTVTMIAGSSTAGIASAQTVATNLTGQERYETAVKISQDGWKNADEIVVVNDSSIADALSATPFAKAKNAPILLTGKDKLNDKTKAEIQRLKAKKIYLIGGTSVLSTNIEKQIKDLKISFERISGAERYQTSLELAKRLDAISDVKKIAVVNGEKGLADAVSVGAPAAQNNMPVILADSKNGTAAADKFIKDAGITQSYVVGGESSVSEAVKNKLPNSTRLGGTDRNDTNAKVVKEFYKKTDLKNAYVTKDGMAKQDQLIDALAVGVLGAKNQSPVVLVGKNLSASQKSLVNSKSFDKITKVGGNGNETAFNEMKSLQEVSTVEAKTISELKSAVDKATANDVINFKPNSEVKEAFTIQTDKAVTVNLNGTYTKTVTINMPNGDVNNYAKVDDVVIDDVKDGTFINYGKITNLKVNDKNGAKIENNSKGEIGSLTVASGASQVKVTNGGKITTVTNNSKGTTIDNKGTISTVKGDNSPSISGNNPSSNSSGGSSSSGGGSHGGGSSSGGSSSGGSSSSNKNQAAPTGITATSPTSAANSDGVISGVTDAMEYRLKTNSAWIKVESGKTEITGLSPGIYEVRYTAKSGYNAGAIKEIEIPAYAEDQEQEAPGSLEVIAPSEANNDGKITGVTDAMEYKLKTNQDWIKVESGKTEITDLSPGIYEVRYAAKPGYNAGAITEITIKENGQDQDQIAPVGLSATSPTTAANNDGKITGVTDAMEYKLKTNQNWTSVVTGETEITGLSPGTYEVRYAAKTGYNAGTAAEVEVKAYVANQEQEAPTGLSATSPTTADDNDGKITGVTDAMEYKLKTNQNWTSVVTGETEITGLSPGTYEVRYAAKTGYNAG